MEPCGKIDILIVDDHPVVRAGLASMLRTHADLSVVGSACSGEEALRMATRLNPDILLVDLRMPGMSGIDLIRAVRERSSSGAGPRAIVLTSYETDEDIYRAVEAGAHGYLLKDTSEQEMIEAIRSAYAGKRYFSSEIAARLAERMNRTSLTPRENQILQMLAKGLTNKEVGRVLGISENTARNHVNSINSASRENQWSKSRRDGTAGSRNRFPRLKTTQPLVHCHTLLLFVMLGRVFSL